MTELSNPSMNCTISDSHMAESNSEDFMQLKIEEPAISKYINHFIGENSIVEICNSIEDIDSAV